MRLTSRLYRLRSFGSFDLASSANRLAVDTSFALAILDESHAFYDVANIAAGDTALALSGHAAFETFSTLTRMPGQRRVEPSVVAETLRLTFPEWCPLSARGANRIFTQFADLGVVGGAVYDALVAAAALENDRTLLSFDRRAEATYRKVGVTYALLGDG